MTPIKIGQNAATLETSPAFEPFSRVTLIVGTDENGNEVIYTAGDDAGRELTAKCPWATQTIANNLLTALGGYVYQPFTAGDALLDPAAELGDEVSVGDITSQLGSIATTFDALYTADIEAPESEEINHEYPYQDNGTRNIERKIAQSSASLKIDIDAIIAQVTDGQGNYTALTLRSDGLHVGNAQGTVTIGSGSIHIPNGAISFGDGTLNGALQAAYNNTGGGDPNPSYIHNTYISKTKVISPHVYGGDLYATGQGNTAGTNPAFYMSDGVTGSGANTEPNEPKGWLCYDKNGAGTSQEAQNRVFLHSEPGVALKLDAGGDMSLEADDSIYFLSYLKLRKGVNYGTAAQRDAITPENGQIFFVVE